MRKRIFLFFVGFLTLFSTADRLLAGETLTNEKIIELVMAQLSDDMILTLIDNSSAEFKTDVDSIRLLKENGVSEKIIEAIVKKANLGSLILPKEVGVYYMAEKGLGQFEPEVVTWKNAGSFITKGATGGHINGIIQNAESKYFLNGNEEVYIHTPEGISGTEYLLLRLDQKKTHRQFRAVTRGLFTHSGGAEKHAVVFEAEKVSSRIYRIKLPQLSPGEYGIVPPGSLGSGGGMSGSPGKIYAFSVRR